MRQLSSIRWKAIERSRSKYYRAAEVSFRRALLKQLEPVINYAASSPNVDAEILKQLIKSEPLERAFEYVYTTTGVDFAQSQFNKFVSGVSLKETFGVAMKDFVNRNAGQKITSITNVTKRDAQRIINKVLSENLNDATGDLSSKLVAGLERQGAELSKWRARMISRTEVATASNIGQQVGAEKAATEAGVSMQKVWLATMDDRVRDAHFQTNGVTVEMNDTFTVNGEQMNTPGDPNGSAANVINCRCALQYFIPKSRGI